MNNIPPQQIIQQLKIIRFAIFSGIIVFALAIVFLYYFAGLDRRTIYLLSACWILMTAADMLALKFIKKKHLETLDKILAQQDKK